jgi:hypothetical protein
MRPREALVKRVMAATAAALVMMALVSSASLAGGGNSDKAKLCQKDGYLALGGSSGPFATEDACVSYAAQGGVLDLPVGVVMPSAFGPPLGRQLEAFSEALAAAGYSAPILTTETPGDEMEQVEELIARHQGARPRRRTAPLPTSWTWRTPPASWSSPMTVSSSTPARSTTTSLSTAWR